MIVRNYIPSQTIILFHIFVDFVVEVVVVVAEVAFDGVVVDIVDVGIRILILVIYVALAFSLA